MLLVRADASVESGTGHVLRCLALAQAWQDAGGRAIFALAETTPAVTRRLQRENVEVLTISAAPGSTEDAGQLKQHARASRADWVVVDGYRFAAEYQREVKSGGFSTLLLDDAGTADPSADLILNQNSNARESSYSGCDSGRLLLGPRYALLRREFKARRDEQRHCAPLAARLLVTMGGSDPDNLTSLVIQALGLLETRSLRSTVVAGGSNPNVPALRKAVSRIDNNVAILDSAPEMSALMMEADMALIAGGGTLWELLCLGSPVLSFARNPVQGRILAELHQRGVVQYLGDPQTLTPSEVAAAIDDLAHSPDRRSKMSMLGRQEVDGEGARRVCQRMAECT